VNSIAHQPSQGGLQSFDKVRAMPNGEMLHKIAGRARCRVVIPSVGHGKVAVEIRGVGLAAPGADAHGIEANAVMPMAPKSARQRADVVVPRPPATKSRDRGLSRLNRWCRASQTGESLFDVIAAVGDSGQSLRGFTPYIFIFRPQAA